MHRLLITLMLSLSLLVSSSAFADDKEEVYSAPTESDQTEEVSEPAKIRTGNGPIAEDCAKRFRGPVARTACEVFVHKMIDSGMDYDIYSLEFFERDHRERVQVLEASNEQLKTETVALKSQVEVLQDRLDQLETKLKEEER